MHEKSGTRTGMGSCNAAYTLATPEKRRCLCKRSTLFQIHLLHDSIRLLFRHV